MPQPSNAILSQPSYWNPQGSQVVPGMEGAAEQLRQLELRHASGQDTLLAMLARARAAPAQAQGLMPLLAQAGPPMPPAIAGQGGDPSWYRPDGSMKGRGFLGPLKHKSGGTATELTIGVNINGKDMEIPSLVPTLTQAEIQHLMSGGAPWGAIEKKATDHARMRMEQGLPVFAE